MIRPGVRLHAIAEPELRAYVDRALGSCAHASWRWALVVDADRTLALPDTGRLVGAAFDLNTRIRAVFEAQGYSNEAFAQVSEIWSGIPGDCYLAEIDAVASTISLFAGWREIFSRIAGELPIIVVTSGIPQLWRRILALHGYAWIPVIGGCHSHLDDHYVDGETKRRVVELVQAQGRRVVAAGDSLIDESMLRQADLPLIVPDHKGSVALRRALADVAGVRLFCHDHRPLSDFPRMTPSELLELLLTP